MLSFAHIWDNVYLAVESLTKAGRIQDRLYSAHIGALQWLRTSDFPQDLQDDFTAITDALTSGVEGNQENTRALIDALSDEEAEEIAENIFHLFVELALLGA